MKTAELVTSVLVIVIVYAAFMQKFFDDGTPGRRRAGRGRVLGVRAATVPALAGRVPEPQGDAMYREPPGCRHVGCVRRPAGSRRSRQDAPWRQARRDRIPG